LATFAPVAVILGYAYFLFNKTKEVMPMLFIRRPVFFRLGRLEVFAEGWRPEAGERWTQTTNRTTAVAKEFQLWMPGLHLVVCLLRRCEVAEVSA